MNFTISCRITSNKCGYAVFIASSVSQVASGVGGEGQWPEVAGSGGWWQKTATMGGGRGLS